VWLHAGLEAGMWREAGWRLACSWLVAGMKLPTCRQGWKPACSRPEAGLPLGVQHKSGPMQRGHTSTMVWCKGAPFPSSMAAIRAAPCVPLLWSHHC
jgi:hypothetical protein